jgi:hypothetical protein
MAGTVRGGGAGTARCGVADPLDAAAAALEEYVPTAALNNDVLPFGLGGRNVS